MSYPCCFSWNNLVFTSCVKQPLSSAWRERKRIPGFLICYPKSQSSTYENFSLAIERNFTNVLASFYVLTFSQVPKMAWNVFINHWITLATLCLLPSLLKAYHISAIINFMECPKVPQYFVILFFAYVDPQIIAFFLLFLSWPIVTALLNSTQT